MKNQLKIRISTNGWINQNDDCIKTIYFSDDRRGTMTTEESFRRIYERLH